MGRSMCGSLDTGTGSSQAEGAKPALAHHIAIGSLCVLFPTYQNTGLGFLIEIGVGQARQATSITHDTRTHALRKRRKRRRWRWAAPAPAAAAAAAPAGHNRLNLNRDRPPVKKQRRHGLHAAAHIQTGTAPHRLEPPPPPRLLPAAAGYRGPRPAGRAVRGAAPAGTGGVGPEDSLQTARCSASPVSVYRGGPDGYLTQSTLIDRSIHTYADEAFKATNRFNWPEAEKAWTKVLELDTQNAAAYSNRGNTRTRWVS